jgi:hypothetical protein
VCENERPRIYKYIYIYIYLFSCFFWAEELRAGNLYVSEVWLNLNSFSELLKKEPFANYHERLNVAVD